MVRCTVAFDHWRADVDVEESEIVEQVATRAQIKLLKGCESLPPLAKCVLYSHRLDKDLQLNDDALVVIQDGDLLEIKLPVRQRSQRNHKDMKKWDPTTAATNASPPASRDSTSTSRIGIFTVVVLQAKNLPLVSRIGLTRCFVAVRLLPYRIQECTPPAFGPIFAWTNPLRLKHFDPLHHDLYLQFKVFESPPLGQEKLLASLTIPLEEFMENAGLTTMTWVDLTSERSATPLPFQGGRLQFSCCFHPKVANGPTFRRLLDNIVVENNDKYGTRISDLNRARTVRDLMKIQQKVKEKYKKSTDDVNHQVRGQFTFTLHGFHLCGPQCSRIDGHSSHTYPDYDPILRIKFDDVSTERRYGATECASAHFEEQWPVYSAHSALTIDVLKRVSIAIAGGKYHRLADGKPATKTCSLTISCFDILEKRAASYTADPPKSTKGPGKHSALQGYDWIPFYQGDEEVGLAQIRADYHESFLAIISPEPSADLAFVYPEERSFDPSIVQRNFERLDDIFRSFKAMQVYAAEVLEWKNPWQTLSLWIGLTLLCIYMPMAHLPVVPTTALVCVMVVNYMRFRKGYTHKKWIENIPGNRRLKIFRPVATLRLIPISASNLKPLDGSKTSPDSFVRMYYEPNYKNIPVHLIAQTECVSNSRDPVWARTHRGDEFLHRNSKWLRDMFRHLSSYEQDAVLHDVVERWKSPNGGVDMYAFKYPILQSVTTNPATNEDELIPWSNCPGVIRFDVLQDKADGPCLLGRVRVPIKFLISNEHTGGPQQDVEQSYPLAVPTKKPATVAGTTTLTSSLSSSSSALASTSASASAPTAPSTPGISAVPLSSSGKSTDSESSDSGDTPMLRLRMQIVLREPKTKVTLKEMLASEAVYGVIELESEKELSLVEKYHKAKDVALTIQQTLGSICSFIERVKNLFLWVHPIKSLVVFIGLVVVSIFYFFVPFRYILLWVVTKRFTRKFHHLVDNDKIRIQNFLNSIPCDIDMKKIYYWKNQAFLREKEHTEAQAKLQAEWAGNIWKHGDKMFNSWNERYGAVRSGRLEFWQNINDAKSGIPPKSFMMLSSTVDKVSQTKKHFFPRDSYPLAVYDISPRYLVYNPRGKKRVVCAKTEEDFTSLVAAIQKSGERIGRSSSTPLPHRKSDSF